MTLDRVDLKILEVLQENGRISNQELADRVHLSASPCLRRVKALEQAGIIAGYRAVLDAKALGYPLMALINVSLDHSAERLPQFEQEVGLIPEVLECLQITGQGADYQLKVVVRDMDSYQNLLINRIARIEGVRGVVSSFVLRRVIDNTVLPLKLPG